MLMCLSANCVDHDQTQPSDSIVFAQAFLNIKGMQIQYFVELDVVKCCCYLIKKGKKTSMCIG